MNKIEKKLLSVTPGSIGVNVVENDLPFAIREFKSVVKASGRITSIKTCFEKKSIIKKKRLDTAKFKQYLTDKRQKQG